MAAVHQITVKSWLGDDCRRFQVDFPSLSFSALSDKVKEVYKIPADDFLVKYRDTENDLVTVTNDAELADMLLCLGIRESEGPSSILKLTIITAPPPQSEDRLPAELPEDIRCRFSTEFSDQEILEVLRDISHYISARDPGNKAQTDASSTFSLITPSVMPKIVAVLTENHGKLVSKIRPPSATASPQGPVQDWSVKQVVEWAKNTGVPDLDKIFEAQEVTGDVLLELTHEILKEMGILSMGRRVKILRLIERLTDRKPVMPSRQKSRHSSSEGSGNGIHPKTSLRR